MLIIIIIRSFNVGNIKSKNGKKRKRFRLKNENDLFNPTKTGGRWTEHQSIIWHHKKSGHHTGCPYQPFPRMGSESLWPRGRGSHIDSTYIYVVVPAFWVLCFFVFLFLFFEDFGIATPGGSSNVFNLHRFGVFWALLKKHPIWAKLGVSFTKLVY